MGRLDRMLILAVALAAAGCGDGMGKVRGKVTAGGKPVCWGSVTLMDSKGQYYQGELGLDGSFEIDRCPAGPMKVGVYSPNPTDARDRGGQAAGAKTGGTGGNDPRSAFLSSQPKKDTPPDKPKPAQGQWFPLNDKLTDPTTSGLTVEVRRGTDVVIDIPK